MYTKEVIEKKSKRINNLLIAIIIIVIILMVEVTYIYYHSEEDKKTVIEFNDSITNVINVGKIPSIDINNLNNEISALEFVDSVGSGLELGNNKYTARIDENKVIVSINGNEKEYNIKNPKSIVIGALENKYVTIYILSKDGKLYNIKYNIINDSEESCIYSLKDIESIDIDTGEVNILNKDNFEPSLYFKTSDNKIYTSDKLVDNQKYFVELINK